MSEPQVRWGYTPDLEQGTHGRTSCRVSEDACAGEGTKESWGLGHTGGLTRSDQRASFLFSFLLLENGLTDMEKKKIRTNTVLLDWNQQ